jgi:HAD superfamily hydrolase (TIGR01509 family)
MACTGKSVEHIVGVLSEKYGIKDRDAFARSRKAFIDSFVGGKELKLLPHAMEAMDFFRSAGMPVAIASGSRREELHIKLSRSAIIGLVNAAVSESDVERGKPFPDIYRKAAEVLGVDPKACVSFEDTPSGVASAKSAGMHCFAVPNVFMGGGDFSMADGVFPSLKEAVEHVKKIISARRRRFDAAIIICLPKQGHHS